MALYNHLSKDIKEHAEGLHTSFRLISKTDEDLKRMITNWNKENEEACGFSLIYDPNFISGFHIEKQRPVEIHYHTHITQSEYCCESDSDISDSESVESGTDSDETYSDESDSDESDSDESDSDESDSDESDSDESDSDESDSEEVSWRRRRH
tara:strand:- start:1518 stop:1976 length:459 start_codon:yes stop_codon:yes gene_type:complete